MPRQRIPVVVSLLLLMMGSLLSSSVEAQPPRLTARGKQQFRPLVGQARGRLTRAKSIRQRVETGHSAALTDHKTALMSAIEAKVKKELGKKTRLRDLIAREEGHLASLEGQVKEGNLKLSRHRQGTTWFSRNIFAISAKGKTKAARYHRTRKDLARERAKQARSEKRLERRRKGLEVLDGRLADLDVQRRQAPERAAYLADVDKKKLIAEAEKLEQDTEKELTKAIAKQLDSDPEFGPLSEQLAKAEAAVTAGDSADKQRREALLSRPRLFQRASDRADDKSRKHART
jgi:hypothetical protein